MEKINTDDLLVKILSLLPTKVAVTTSILSRRWKFLWLRVPKLEYDDDRDTKPSNRRRFRRFIKRTLPLHRVPVLESLRLKFSTLPFQPEDIKLCVEAAVSHCVRELSIDYYPHPYKFATLPFATLPFCVYTCKSLETLALSYAILMVVPRMACLPSLKNLLLQGVRYVDESFQLLDESHTVCFPSLKSLHLKEVIFTDEKYLRSLLGNCPVLEELVMELDEYDTMGAVHIIVPSLKSLSLDIDCDRSSDVVEIVAPSLEYIKLNDHSDNKYLIENMPKLEEAYIDANIFEYEKFLGAFTSVKRLNLCLMLQRSLVIYFYMKF